MQQELHGLKPEGGPRRAPSSKLKTAARTRHRTRRSPLAGQKERFRFETLLSDLSARLVRLPFDEVDREIDRGLRRILEFFRVDRCGLLRGTPDKATFQVTHVWSAKEIPPVAPRAKFPTMFLPWSYQRLNIQREVVSIATLNEMPAKAGADKQTFMAWRVRSHLSIPIVVAGSEDYVITIHSVRDQRAWPREYIPRLRLAGEVFVNALERRRAEGVLRESEARFRQVADDSPVMIWMSGPDKGCTYMNKGWLEFTGRTMEQECGNGWAQGVHPDDLQRCLDTYVRAFDARERFSMEYRLRRADGEYRWLLDNGVPRLITGGRFAGFIGSCIDITERKRVEDEMEHLRLELSHVSRVTTAGEMAAALAHELNQPLGAILNNAEAAEILMHKQAPAADEIRDIFADIRHDAQRAGEVISRIRDLLRRRPLDARPLDVSRLIEGVTKLVQAVALSRKVIVRAEAVADLPLVRGDVVHLKQVLLNLIFNAMESMVDRPASERQVLIRAAPHESMGVVVAVTDGGTGIPPTSMPRLFEPFFTTKREGLGMGLPICRRIIEAHGGRIDAENNPDRGATVRFTLPGVKEQG